MKQHITPKQAQEITEEQFYSLFKEPPVKREDWFSYHHKKITIGFMIEYLKDNLQMPIYIHTNGIEWNLAFEIGEDRFLDKFITSEELSDLLWDMTRDCVRADYLDLEEQ